MVVNAYPRDGDPYRSGFVHRRIKGYQAAGIYATAFVVDSAEKSPSRYDYDEVPVITGTAEVLQEVASRGSFDAFMVHFPDRPRIAPLVAAGVTKPVMVWIHGYEAERWYRRWFNFIDTAEGLERALKLRETAFASRNMFLGELIRKSPPNYRFINVSEWFKRYIVEPDLDVSLPQGIVIPNYIDGSIFRYQRKASESRRRILSVRPFGSKKYANDLTVRAVLELSKRPGFDELEFTICGSGSQFEETVSPLRPFRNVSLIERLFTQEEIASLHREHGIFLCPTRLDSQGVSMCEAMSSGLAVVSNDVSAIPEFVQHDVSGLLAKPEDPADIAEQITRLQTDPDLFSKISRQGSLYVQAKCGYEATIGAEVDLTRQLVAHYE